ncbi:hypothetical protein BAY1663_03300 [Pseudomonas sp. BAY1663]|uniref:hypothetical protein n=1 Tax=Pseudomonas sp. BAY1663 TaxID=1439940 RepID=UPI00042DE7FA|nr:hypothetical protein [Pseudomonas sp. BAY1663]EXF44311.1 hypothetical protein BAY1663_03300 [Pseudomonas sp. BAY1663]
MSKGMDAKKNAKKKPLKTAQEKRMAKRDKKHGTTTLLGAHAAPRQLTRHRDAPPEPIGAGRLAVKLKPGAAAAIRTASRPRR